MEGFDMEEAVRPSLPGPDDPALPARAARIAAPRLARHSFTLTNGHRVGLAVCGKGVPLVVVHGYSAEGILYAQTLSRLVGMGFKVIAIDTAGHGGTGGLPGGGARLGAYTELLGRVVDELGIRRAVFAGHSMGGRLVTELAADHPDRTIGVILLDAIVGQTWDRMVDVSRFVPGLLAGVGAALAVDVATTLPVLRDPRQAGKLARLAAPMVWSDACHPWRLVGPGISILRSRGSGWMLQRLAQEQVPVIAIHGDRDLAVPLATARAAAREAKGTLVTVHGAGHSWLLSDPETLPAIIGELLHGRLGAAYRDALAAEGLDPAVATVDDIERNLYSRRAPIVRLTPTLHFDALDVPRRRPRYRWTVTDEAAPVDGAAAARTLAANGNGHAAPAPNGEGRRRRRAGCVARLLP
jgi:pimeloyl-ACP methyl ester carboxylesterase